MQCQTTLEQLSELLRSDDAAAEANWSLRRHIDQCDECQRRLDGLTDDRVLTAAARRYVPTDADTSVLQTALDTVDTLWRQRPSNATSDDETGESSLLDPARLLDPSDQPDRVQSSKLDSRSSRSSKSSDLGNVGRYQVQAVLGRGGMSVVFAAWDPLLERRVAIKVFHTHEDPRVWKRFVREARAAARIQHDAVVTVFEVIERADRPPAIVMPLMAGGTLSDQTGRAEIGPQRAAEIVARVADGLGEVHRCGHVHRDIKPANILFDDLGRAKLGDFSLVRRNKDEPLTEANVLPGTPEYIAPEMLLDGAEASSSSDIYQLGLTLYVMLTGACPYQGSVRAVLRQIIEGPPARPSKHSDQIPRDLETICLKAINRIPAERYQTAEELAADLRRFLSGEPILARRPGLLRRGRRWARRHPIATAVVGIGLPCTTLLSIGYAAYQQQSEQFAFQKQVITAQRDAEREQLVEETHRADVAELRSDQVLSQSLTAVFAAKQIREPEWVDTEKMLLNSLLGGFEQGFEQMQLAPQRNENFGEMALSIAKLRARVERTEDAKDAFEQAIRDFDQRLTETPTEQLKQLISDALRGHGAACTKLERPDLAIESLRRACEIARSQSKAQPQSLKWQLERATSETEYGHALIASDNMNQAATRLAIASTCIHLIAESDRPQFDLVGFRELFADASGELARAYRGLGEYEHAIAFQHLAVTQNDRLGSDELQHVRQADSRAALSELLVEAGEKGDAATELWQAIDLIDQAITQSNMAGRYDRRRTEWQARADQLRQ